jgi:hypothetical protein
VIMCNPSGFKSHGYRSQAQGTAVRTVYCLIISGIPGANPFAADDRFGKGAASEYTLSNVAANSNRDQWVPCMLFFGNGLGALDFSGTRSSSPGCLYAKLQCGPTPLWFLLKYLLCHPVHLRMLADLNTIHH